MNKIFILFSFIFIVNISGQDYRSIKSIYGNVDCSSKLFEKYNQLMKNYEDSLENNLKNLHYSYFYNTFYYDKDSLRRNVSINNVGLSYEDYFSYEYNNYKIYGKHSSENSLNPNILEIFKNKKHIETISINKETESLELFSGRYKKTIIYSNKLNVPCYSYYVQDTYMNNVFVGKEMTCENGYEKVIDWDNTFKINNDDLLEILPKIYDKAVKIQKNRVIILKKNNDLAITEEMSEKTFGTLDKFNRDFKIALKNLSEGTNEIEFQRFINEAGLPIWFVRYGIGISINGVTGEIINVLGMKNQIE